MTHEDKRGGVRDATTLGVSRFYMYCTLMSKKQFLHSAGRRFIRRANPLFYDSA